ncbi:hypothetical protein [Leptotrichia massiliensis]|uniref:hypothetical protein n=1 Tax=Leptotrichia massiliensis TaxID=1852388 RepID=UPI0008DB1B37|nr:hypothetical protein [Leptotrichia massiliensis]
MNVITTVLNQFGGNVINLVAVALAGFVVKGISTYLVKGYRYLLKKKMARYVTQFIPNGIAFGELLKGVKPNEERLVQAVLTVQNLVLKMFPERLRPTVDKLFDEKAIAREIERQLNEDKQEGLVKPTAVEEE